MNMFTTRSEKTGKTPTKATKSMFASAAILSVGLMGCSSAQDVVENCKGNGQIPSQYEDNATGCKTGPSSIANTDMINNPSIDQRPNDTPDMKMGNGDMGSVCNIYPLAQVTFKITGPNTIVSEDVNGNQLGGLVLRDVKRGINGTKYKVDIAVGCFGAVPGQEEYNIFNGLKNTEAISVTSPTNGDGSGKIDFAWKEQVQVEAARGNRVATISLNAVAADRSVTGTLEIVNK